MLVENLNCKIEHTNKFYQKYVHKLVFINVL